MCTSKTLTKFHKTKNKNKKWFCRSSLQCFIIKSVLIKHKENSLSINGKQSVKLEKGIIEFENRFKQIPVLFKIYADFECNLRGVECYECSYTKKYQDHIPCSFAYKFACVDDKFTKRIVVYIGENAAFEFIKAILRDYKYWKKVMNKEKEEHLFQESNSCWICKKLIDNNEEKVRDHCHLTGKFRGAAHWDCNIE